MAVKNVDGVIRKRTLIEKTRRNVLMWVGGAATLIGVIAVVCWMLIQSALFNHKIIGMKQDTLDQIQQNIGVVPDLKGSIKHLNDDPQLVMVKSSYESKGLQVILDALPADSNRMALGASLQHKVFMNEGVSLDSLTIEGVDSGSTGGVDMGDGLIPLEFNAVISGSPNDIRNALVRLESSIRAVNLKNVSAITSGGSVSLRLAGEVYYYPPADLSLGSEVIKE